MSFKEWFDQLTPGQKLNHYFRRCDHLHKSIVDKTMVQAEIYAAQHRILGILNHKPEMSQKEIADVMEVSTATVAVTLKKMEKSGYVVKKMDDTDNRINKIKLTEKGTQLLYQGFDIMNRIDQDTVRDFTEEELALFASFMERYLRRLNEMAEIDYAAEAKVQQLEKDNKK